MYSSPTAPSGTGLRYASRTKVCVLAIGRPMGIGPAAEVPRWTVDQMVVSVGPYIFHNSLHRGRSSFARSGGRDSPPQRTLRVDEPLQPASTSARHVAGVACITLQCESRIRSIKRTGSWDSS